MEVPRSILRGSQIKTSEYCEKNTIKRQFWTKVVVNDDCIIVKAEGSPNVAGLFKGKSEETHSINKYNCNLADLGVVILQQVKMREKVDIIAVIFVFVSRELHSCSLLG